MGVRRAMEMVLAEANKREGPIFTFGPLIHNRQVLDLLEFMASDNVLDQFAGIMKKPLKDLKAVCYYGCQANRPPKITGRTDYENPLDMDRVVKACGAKSIDWPYKTDCCGASHVVAGLSKP